jgi:hypothetical protein
MYGPRHPSHDEPMTRFCLLSTTNEPFAPLARMGMHRAGIDHGSLEMAEARNHAAAAAAASAILVPEETGLDHDLDTLPQEMTEERRRMYRRAGTLPTGRTAVARASAKRRWNASQSTDTHMAKRQK